MSRWKRGIKGPKHESNPLVQCGQWEQGPRRKAKTRHTPKPTVHTNVPTQLTCHDDELGVGSMPRQGNPQSHPSPKIESLVSAGGKGKIVQLTENHFAQV